MPAMFQSIQEPANTLPRDTMRPGRTHMGVSWVVTHNRGGIWPGKISGKQGEWGGVEIRGAKLGGVSYATGSSGKNVIAGRNLERYKGLKPQSKKVLGVRGRVSKVSGQVGERGRKVPNLSEWRGFGSSSGGTFVPGSPCHINYDHGECPANGGSFGCEGMKARAAFQSAQRVSISGALVDLGIC